MPGSMAISHTDALVMLSHADAEQLTAVLRQMSALLEQPGGDRLSDAQAEALCEGKLRRDELAEWSRKLSDYLKDHL
ncbi:hypothetical protein F4556_005389 [Kitasatospora gansuensis]|uniref:Uncharacterized protein n=1 Tax=Kitasatospora gansuensis TaxID=258050 RepID=A0A7W7SG71_9ACTN|nr:hypothetical protein [Kitasatospora gansuensis]MBB4949854.1 hypothetical protein [Kitasatospora gansuensis]